MKNENKDFNQIILYDSNIETKNTNYDCDCDKILFKIPNSTNGFLFKETNQGQTQENYYKLGNSDSPVFRDQIELLIADKCPNGYERMQIGVNENQNLFITLQNENKQSSYIEVKSLNQSDLKAPLKNIWENSKYSKKLKVNGVKYPTPTQSKTKSKTKSKSKSKQNNFENQM